MYSIPGGLAIVLVRTVHYNYFQKGYASDPTVEFKMADKIKDYVKYIIKCILMYTRFPRLSNILIRS